MDLNLGGKVVLVTGSERGIGFQIATNFIEEGATVIFNGRQKDFQELNNTWFQGRNMYYLPGNLTRSEDCKKLVEKIESLFGRLDVLVCNVGSGDSVPPGRENQEELQKMLDINLFTSTNSIEACKKLLSKGKGSVVCISSICGREVVEGAPIGYSVAKAALEAYVRGSSRPLALLGIRINSISLGNILFDGSVWDKRLKNDEQSTRKLIGERVALGLFGSPDDVANLALFLASEVSKFITGSSYVLDGGQVHQ